MLSLHQFLWKLCIFVYMAPLWKLIDSGVAYFHSMKISVISNSLVNVIILLLCIESCCFFKIDRELRDTSDSWDINNCNSIRRTFLENGRCRCSFSQGSSILSTNTGQIGCTMNSHIDSGKNTWIFLY